MKTACLNRSPAVVDSPELDKATVDVLSSVPDIPAFSDDIVLINGYIVIGHDKLSAMGSS